MKWLKWLDKNLESTMIVLTLMMMTVLIALQVILRYVFENSLSWSEELIRWLFIWSIWIGVSYAFKERRHVAVTAFIDRLPAKGFLVVSVIVNIVILWFMFKLFEFGLAQVNSPSIMRQSSIALFWPGMGEAVGMRWLYYSVPVGALLSAFRLLQVIFADIKQVFVKPLNNQGVTGE